MKYMKLGSRPDTFYTLDSARYVSSEVSSDLIVQVEGTRYMLHKFPMLSKCLRLRRVCSESPASSHPQMLHLPAFPGGSDAFELCAKFCYGIAVTVGAHNVVAVRCAAEYLQMTEDVEKRNLIYKIEVFFTSCILHGWRDAIVALQSTKAFFQQAEDLEVTPRCIEAIASKVVSHPTKANLSHSYSRREAAERPTSRGWWWAEDVSDLRIDLFWRTMATVKSAGKVPPALIGDALKIYAARWLPAGDSSSGEEAVSRHRVILESIISLLPADRGAVSCAFMLKLLRTAAMLDASPSSRTELIRGAAVRLEEARVSDLLMPSPNGGGTVYDVDLVLSILEEFMLQDQLSPPASPLRGRRGGLDRRRRSRSAENVDFEFQESSRRSSSASHGSKLKAAKLVDGYLREIAADVKLPVSKMLAVAKAVPDFARIDHDDLYRAIDIYLKAHPDLSKSERKRLCRILDCKKLSMEACMHAAQNELLPLRVVVQVLFFEQTRAAVAGGPVAELPRNIQELFAAHTRDTSSATTTFSTATSVQAEDQWSFSGPKSPKPLKPSATLKMKLAEEDGEMEGRDLQLNGGLVGKGSKFKERCAAPARPKRMLSKLWPINRSASEKN